MDNTNIINKLITFLFIIGLSLSLIFVFFAQERVYREITFGDLSLGSEKLFRSFSVIFIFIAVILSFFVAKKKYLTKIFLAYFLILGYITINYLLTGPGIDDFTGVMDIKGIGPWMTLGLIFVSFHDKRYNLFKSFLFISVVVISIYVFYNLNDFGIGLFRGQALSKYRVFATNLVWITPFVFLILKNNKKLQALRFFALFIGISTALIIQTRSFLLIYLLVLIFDFFHTTKKTVYFIGGAILGLLFIYILLNTESFSTSYELLLARGTEDSRSNQLIEFLDQLNVFDLIVGKGYDSFWYFGGFPYAYLDNQWLLLIWWAGLIPATIYKIG